jgi:hypothetical protein
MYDYNYIHMLLTNHYNSYSKIVYSKKKKKNPFQNCSSIPFSLKEKYLPPKKNNNAHPLKASP